MKENRLKGAWAKIISVLVAVAMVIPLAFSGLSSENVYAAMDDDMHKTTSNHEFFPTLLHLDTHAPLGTPGDSSSDKNFYVKISGTSDYRMGYLESSITVSN